jgi:molybdenum cofactor cytidylyltransferase
MADTVALLLAAGESSRMGSLKAFLPWHGTTLLDHQITVLRQAGICRVIVVLGHRAEILKPTVQDREGVTWTVNPDYAQGKTTSINAGLSALAPDEPAAILILNVDQPRSPETITELLRRHLEAEALITIPTYQGKGGHPIIIDSALLQDLRSITEETLGVKDVVRSHQERTQRTEMATAEVLWDLNTPEEYQQALRT